MNPTRPPRRFGLVCLAGGLLLAVAGRGAAAGPNGPDVQFAADETGLALAHGGQVAPVWVADDDWPGVRRAAGDLQSDLARVTGVRPALAGRMVAGTPAAVIVGTVGHSSLIDTLVRDGKLRVDDLAGRWEASVRAVVEHPVPGVARALVIAGSDKRGTIYGIYDLSEQIGVSPWYWWADVPVRHRDEIAVRPGRRLEPGPAVRYRGIFLNDEAPALTNWAREKFGGFNHEFYGHVFELLLRLHANYLWPAMWASAFNEDDPENPRLADEYGIVMGTSHHEPMLRAQQEWKRHGTGAWNYAANADVLRRFWTDGIRRNRNFESLVTVGMRGDGDLPMSEEANVALLQGIVADQRTILAAEVNPDVTRVPQVWALYKEVQAYYERGMRVPDDVTLLWCDDNWGNLRRLPTPAERGRAGGAGIYYHLDYVGGPRNYKWLGTVPLTKIQEQMHLAWAYGADRIWIVNVGDLKPLEVPLEFFLRMAWAPDRWPADRLAEYGRSWAARDFGPASAAEIAELVAAATKFNYRRKPELLAPDTYSLVNYDEAERVERAWDDVETRAQALAGGLAADARDAFNQLVLHPVRAAATVNRLWLAAGRNRLYAAQGRASANDWAARARALFAVDAALTRSWDEMGGGRWRHFMDQTHLGYTSWQQPVRNVMPAVSEVQPSPEPSLAVAVEGATGAWPADFPNETPAALPPLEPCGPSARYLEVFNRGSAPARFRVTASVPWLRAEPAEGEVGPDRRIALSADWSRAPAGESRASVTVADGSGRAVAVVPVVIRHTSPVGAVAGAFLECDGAVVMEALHFGRAVAGDGVDWRVLPDFGLTVGGVTTEPATAASSAPGTASPRLEFPFWLPADRQLATELVVAPTLDFVPGRGLRCAVSLDDGAPVVIDLLADRSPAAWERRVAAGVNRVAGPRFSAAAGNHVWKFWRVDPGVVLERVVLDAGGVRPGALGPPESPRAPAVPLSP